MAAAFDPSDPAQLTTDQRLDEVATILGLGVQRALALSAASLQVSPTILVFDPPDSDSDPLDESAQTRPHVPCG